MFATSLLTVNGVPPHLALDTEVNKYVFVLVMQEYCQISQSILQNVGSISS